MKINPISTNRNFNGIIRYNRRLVKTIPNYTRITFEYNYYPFNDETPEEFAMKAKEFNAKQGRYWDGFNPNTRERCGGMEEYTLVKKSPLNISMNEYITLQLMGFSDCDILNNILKDNR